MFNTREDWLLAAVEKFRHEFSANTDFGLPEDIHVSVGFPLGSRKAIGQSTTMSLGARTALG